MPLVQINQTIRKVDFNVVDRRLVFFTFSLRINVVSS
jgi:hypothetical protein